MLSACLLRCLFTGVLIDLLLEHAHTGESSSLTADQCKAILIGQALQQESEDWFYPERCQQEFILIARITIFICIHQEAVRLIISYLRPSPHSIPCRENEAVLFLKAIKHHHCALDIDLLYTVDPCMYVSPLPLSPVLPSTDQCYWLLLYHCRHSCVDLLALQRSWSPSLAPSLRRRSFHGGPYCTDCSHFYWAGSEHSLVVACYCDRFLIFSHSIFGFYSLCCQK